MVKWVNLKTKFHKVFHGFGGEIAKLDFGLPISTLKEIHVNEGKGNCAIVIQLAQLLQMD